MKAVNFHAQILGVSSASLKKMNISIQVSLRMIFDRLVSKATIAIASRDTCSQESTAWLKVTKMVLKDENLLKTNIKLKTGQETIPP